VVSATTSGLGNVASGLMPSPPNAGKTLRAGAGGTSVEMGALGRLYRLSHDVRLVWSSSHLGKSHPPSCQRRRQVRRREPPSVRAQWFKLIA
jgi:hypothetical protein